MATTLRIPLIGPVTPLCLLLSLAALANLVVSIAFIVLLLGGASSLTERAKEAGQFVRILTDTGAVEGQAQETEEPAAETSPAEEPTASEEAAPPEEAAVAEAPSTEPTVPDTEQPVPGAETPVAESGEESAHTDETAVTEEPVSEPVKAARSVETPLAKAPNPALMQAEAEGAAKLPVVGTDGVEPWDYYGKPAVGGADRPMIALVIGGLGMRQDVTEMAMSLPEFVTLSFSPYADGVQRKILHSRTEGFETWLDLPMEPEDYPASDPGPLALLKSLSEPGSVERLRTILAGAHGVSGFVAPAGEVFSSQSAMQAVGEELKKRGLLLLMHERNYNDPNASGRVLYASRSLSAVRTQAMSPVEQQLAELEAIARSNGYAIGLAPPSPAIFEAIVPWSEALREKGLALEPLSAVMRRGRP